MHELHEIYELKDKLIKELGEQGRKGLSETTLKTIDTLAHAAKNVAKVIECCEDEEYSMAMGNGYSRRGRYSMRDSYADDRSYRAADGVTNYVRPDGSYADGGMSYARGRGAGAKRDSMGRYSRADDEIVMGLERLMDTATDEHTRKEIRKLIEQM